jgi:hypothetical protein
MVSHRRIKIYIAWLTRDSLDLHWNEEEKMYCDLGVDDEGRVFDLNYLSHILSCLVSQMNLHMSATRDTFHCSL